VVIMAGAIGAGLALTGCDDTAAAGVEVVQIKGEKFFLELAADNATRTLGLGGREFIAADGGMLFVFPEEAPKSFWMKNTPLPLDIVFINLRGIVVNIHEHAEPFSTRNIVSTKPAIYVLEIPAGSAKTYGLKAGDSITWELE